MAQETTREPEMGLTFEKVWAMFQVTPMSTATGGG
jgi:hypothetical protein